MQPSQIQLWSILVLSTNVNEHEKIAPGRIQKTGKVSYQVRAVKLFTTRQQSKGRKTCVSYIWTNDAKDHILYMQN